MTIDIDRLGEPIVAHFGDWYITDTALVYGPCQYDMTIANLTNGMDWLRHLRGKRWFTGQVEADFLLGRDALLQPHEVLV